MRGANSDLGAASRVTNRGGVLVTDDEVPPGEGPPYYLANGRVPVWYKW